MPKTRSLHQSYQCLVLLPYRRFHLYNTNHPKRPTSFTLGITATAPLSSARNGRAGGAPPAPTIAKGVAAGMWLPSTNRPTTQRPTPTKWGKYRRVPFFSNGGYFLFRSVQMPLFFRNGDRCARWPRGFARARFRRAKYARRALGNHRYLGGFLIRIVVKGSYPRYPIFNI